MSESRRWSDADLQQFHDEFRQHEKKEDDTHARLDDLYEAVFRKEDKDRNIAPGLLQLCARMSSELESMRIAADRQKRFVGGMLFAVTSMGFFLTDTFHRLIDLVKKL